MPFANLTADRRVLNGLGAAFVVVGWTSIAVAYPSLPATVATHFDLAGHPNHFGPKAMLWILPGAMTLAFTVLFAVQLGNLRYNYPFAIAPESRERAQETTRGMLAAFCALTTGIFLAVAHMMIAAASAQPTTFDVAAVWTCVALMLVVFVDYFATLYRTCR